MSETEQRSIAGMAGANVDALIALFDSRETRPAAADNSWRRLLEPLLRAAPSPAHADLEVA